MDEQQKLDRVRLGNKLIIVWPAAIVTICLGLVVPGLVSPLWGVLLGLIMVVLLIAAWVVAGLLRAGSAAEAAAIAAVPRPATCDRCHETDPVTCPRPWLGICPLRSIETGQTYEAFLRKPGRGAGRRAGSAR